MLDLNGRTVVYPASHCHVLVPGVVFNGLCFRYILNVVPCLAQSCILFGHII